MGRGRSGRRREREREALANTPAFDRLLLRPAAIRHTLPSPGPLLDAIAERIAPTWPADISVSGPLSTVSEAKPSRAAKSSEYVKAASPAPITIGQDGTPAPLRECVQRHTRTEVLHALKRTGKGGSRKLERPRKPPSQTRC